jgi:type IV secretion system pilin
MPASLPPQRWHPPTGWSRPPQRRPRLAGRVGWPARAGLAGIGIGAALLLVGWLATPALAQTADPTLGQVIDRLRNVLVGLLVGLATLFLTVGGVRYLFAGGDPGQVEKAKVTLRSAAIGYGLAALAPVLVRLLRYVVGS